MTSHGGRLPPERSDPAWQAGQAPTRIHNAPAPAHQAPSGPVRKILAPQDVEQAPTARWLEHGLPRKPRVGDELRIRPKGQKLDGLADLFAALGDSREPWVREDHGAYAERDWSGKP